MPANRTEPAPGPEEAKEPTPAPAPTTPAASGGIMSWLPLIITVVLMPVLAWGMTKLVLLPQLQKGLGITPVAAAEPSAKQKTKKSGSEAKQESVPMNKLLVNVAGTMGARYLLVSLSVVGNDSEFKAKMQSCDPRLRDMACSVLATKTIADLEKPGARNLIRSELISGFNNILGEAMVEEIYLTEFAIQ